MNRLTIAPLFAATALLTCCARPAEPPRSTDTFVAARADSFAKADRNLLDARQREISDLVAQEGMNAATKRMADTADMQLVLGWLTLVGLAVTAAAAFHSNTMARRALELSTTATMAELQPYLSPENFILFRQNDMWYFRYSVKNFGQTSARNVRWDGTAIEVANDVSAAEMPDTSEWLHSRDIVPNDSNGFGGALDLPETVFNRAFAGEARIVVKLLILYEDGFNRTHVCEINDVRWGEGLSAFRFNQFKPTSHTAQETANWRSFWRKWRTRAPGAMSTMARR